MGATYVDVTIRNPADRQRSWTGKFLVDTGAFDSLVPRVRLEENGRDRNMNNNDNNGFVGGFVRGFCIVFFGGLIILVIIIVLLLA